jgi:hypothetical protein
MAEHIVNIGLCILLNDTAILAKKSRPMVRIMRGMIDIKLHPNISKEDGFSLSRPGKPLIHTKKILSTHKTFS